MSNIKLIQKIRDVAAALAQARVDGTQDEIDDLEAELFELEDDLEFEAQDEYAERHQHGWR